ncbi:MAG TPA: hypothetical protein VK543_16850 [Puia sp.]|nr:hypothetical protein [Puia sp.]
MDNAALIKAYLHNELGIKSPDHPTMEELTAALAGYINHLVSTDFEQLLRLLYRIDVNENKLRHMLKENKGREAGELIASLIIERQILKIKTREQFKSPGGHTDEENW